MSLCMLAIAQVSQQGRERNVTYHFLLQIRFSVVVERDQELSLQRASRRNLKLRNRAFIHLLCP